MDLVQIRPTGKTPVEQCVPVFIVTREGKVYNAEGADFVKSHIEEQFNIHSDLAIYSGPGMNDTQCLAAFMENKPNAYLVLATKESVIFIPQHHNENICLDLKEHPEETSWELLMKVCCLELY